MAGRFEQPLPAGAQRFRPARCLLSKQRNDNIRIGQWLADRPK